MQERLSEVNKGVRRRERIKQLILRKERKVEGECCERYVEELKKGVRMALMKSRHV